MKRTGKIINIEKNKVYLLTKDKEFITVKRNNINPKMGNIYTGTVIQKKTLVQKLLISFLLIGIISASILTYTQFATKYVVIADFNSNVRFEVTSSGKISNVSSKDAEGIELINNTNVLGNTLNDGLIILFDEALKEKKISIPNGYYIGKVLVFVSNNKTELPLDLNTFVSHAEKNNFVVTVNNNTGDFDQ
ncbi:hypothetical protein [Clostridium senegalense]